MIYKALASTLAAVAACGFLGCSKPVAVDNAAKVEEALQSLQGKWEVVSLNRAGKQSNAASLKHSDATVTKDAFSLWEAKVKPGSTSGDLVVDDYTLQVNPAAASNEIDFAYSKGEKQGLVRRGIYALSGDDLKICYGEVGEPRPTEFVGQEKPATTLLVLRRKP